MGEKTFNQRVGEQLRLIRLEKNLSQKTLAMDFDVSTSTISNLERGSTEITMTRLEELLNYFNVNVLSFFARVERVRLPESFLEDMEEKYLLNSKQKELEEQMRLLNLQMADLKNKKGSI